MGTHANQARAELHEAKRDKLPVRVASTVNVSLTTPGSSMDSVALTSGDRILLKDQTAGAQNGIYVWTTSSATLTRATDASAASDFEYGFQVYVREGTLNGGKRWTYTTSTAITLGTTTLTFAQSISSGLIDPTTTRGDLIVRGATAVGRFALGASGSFLGAGSTDPAWTNSASHFDPSGLTGATAASRYVGATTSGAPASGTFSIGDFIIDRTGKVWICTSAGTPGSWTQVSGTGGGGAATTVSNSLSGDVTISSANTYFDGPTVSLTAGTWLLTGEITGVNSSTGTNFTARLWDGTTTVDSASAANNGSGAASTISLHGIVSPGSTTSYKISVAATATSSTVKAAAPFNAVGNNASTLVAIPLVAPQSVYSQSTTAPATATAGTVTTSGVSTARVSPAGAITGVILQPGTFGGQEVSVVNEAIAANSVTFAASGTSNVANGTASVIAGLTARKFVWDSSTALWYPCV